MSLLDVNDLSVTMGGEARVDALSFQLQAGQALGLAGESGSGKTQTALAIMGLSPPNAKLSGSVKLDGRELLGLPAKAMNTCRPQKIAMIFQDPQSALNPYLRIGDQLSAILIEHRLSTAEEAGERVQNILRRVGLPDPERQFQSYPHQLSGGMRQRTLIASALLANPDVLIADEPTTALDVTVQAQILELLHDLRQEMNLALLLITHDLAVIANACDDVLIMERGIGVELGGVGQTFSRPAHQRTRELIDAAMIKDGRARSPRADSSGKPVLEVDGVAVNYRVNQGGKRKKLPAVLPVDLELSPGETLAIVGESGCGKTSLARAIVGLTKYTEGHVTLNGTRQRPTVGQRPRKVHRQMQMVFQDPVASLDPAMRVSKIIAEPLLIHEPALKSKQRASRVSEMLLRTGLDEELGARFPHELSGGQAQRVAIARALIVEPEILICDEAFAALDATIRRDVVEVLQTESRRLSMSLIVISHDLGMVRQMADRVLVMYLGRVCELAAVEEIFRRPRHPYTRALIESMPALNPDRKHSPISIPGEAASPLYPPAGCVFHPRCAYAAEDCVKILPNLQSTGRSKSACLRESVLDLSI